MSSVPCSACGAYRKYQQVYANDGWNMPACPYCGDPAWFQRDTDPDCLCEWTTRDDYLHAKAPCDHCRSLQEHPDPAPAPECTDISDFNLGFNQKVLNDPYPPAACSGDGCEYGRVWMTSDDWMPCMICGGPGPAPVRSQSEGTEQIRENLTYYSVRKKWGRCDACERRRRLRFHFDCMAWFCRRCWKDNAHRIGTRWSP